MKYLYIFLFTCICVHNQTAVKGEVCVLWRQAKAHTSSSSSEIHRVDVYSRELLRSDTLTVFWCIFREMWQAEKSKRHGDSYEVRIKVSILSHAL